MGNQECRIQMHWQQWAQKTQDEDKQKIKTQHRKLTKDEQHGVVNQKYTVNPRFANGN